MKFVNRIGGSGSVEAKRQSAIALALVENDGEGNADDVAEIAAETVKADGIKVEAIHVQALLRGLRAQRDNVADESGATVYTEEESAGAAELLAELPLPSAKQVQGRGRKASPAMAAASSLAFLRKSAK